MLWFFRIPKIPLRTVSSYLNKIGFLLGGIVTAYLLLLLLPTGFSFRSSPYVHYKRMPPAKEENVCCESSATSLSLRCV